MSNPSGHTHPSGSTPSTDFMLDAQIKRWAQTLLLAVAVAFAAWAVLGFVRSQKEKALGDEWRSFANFESALRTGTGESTVPIESVVEPLRPWAKLEQANRSLAQPRPDAAALNEAKGRFESLAKDASAGPAALGIVAGGFGAEAVASSIGGLDAWEKAHAQLADNPAPASAPRAKFVTDQGSFEIAFYSEAAPEHVKNFTKLIQEGFYNGTKFHRVTKSGIFIVQGGDPNTKEDKTETWGQGKLGDGLKVEKNRMGHFVGAVAMAQPSLQPGEKKSSGCQFYIVYAPSHSLDRNYTVFGKVVSGMEAIRKIADSNLVAGTERPATPAIVTQTEWVP